MEGRTDWCMNFCDGKKWLMYMAFVMQPMDMGNLGRDLPGEWLSADLGLPKTEEEKDALRKEYKRKKDEDLTRRKRSRAYRNKKRKNRTGEVEECTTRTGGFDYGEMNEQILENENKKVKILEQLLQGMQTPKASPTPMVEVEGMQNQTLGDPERLKGYMYVADNTDLPEKTREKARMAIVKMLGLMTDEGQPSFSCGKYYLLTLTLSCIHTTDEDAGK